MRRRQDNDDKVPGGPPGFQVPGFGKSGFDPRKFPLAAFLAAVMACLLEGVMSLLLYGTYTETMSLMSDVYVCDLPVLGRTLCAIDEEMTLSHVLALILAVFSIGVPLAIWKEVLAEQIYNAPQLWISKPVNRIKAMIAGCLYALVFLLESVNLYTLIARSGSSGGPFLVKSNNALMDTLAQNQGLGVFVAALIVVINTVVALMTVAAVQNFKNKFKEASE